MQDVNVSRSINFTSIKNILDDYMSNFKNRLATIKAENASEEAIKQLCNEYIVNGANVDKLLNVLNDLERSVMTGHVHLYRKTIERMTNDLIASRHVNVNSEIDNIINNVNKLLKQYSTLDVDKLIDSMTSVESIYLFYKNLSDNLQHVADMSLKHTSNEKVVQAVKSALKYKLSADKEQQEPKAKLESIYHKTDGAPEPIHYKTNGAPALQGEAKKFFDKYEELFNKMHQRKDKSDADKSDADKIKKDGLDKTGFVQLSPSLYSYKKLTYSNSLLFTSATQFFSKNMPRFKNLIIVSDSECIIEYSTGAYVQLTYNQLGKLILEMLDVIVY